MSGDNFGFARPPFGEEFKAEQYFRTPDIDEALAALRYSVIQRRGAAVVTGEEGCGKSALGRTFLGGVPHPAATAFVGRRGAMSNLPTALCEAFQVSVESRGAADEKIGALERYLRQRHADNQLSVMVIDDVDTLGIDDLQMLGALVQPETDGTSLLQLVLLGRVELDETLRDRALLPMKNGLYRTIRLRPLSGDETAGYIRQRLTAVAGGDDGVFASDAIKAVFRATAGIPRRINQLCELALRSAAETRTRPVTAQMIHDAQQRLDKTAPLAVRASDPIRAGNWTQMRAVERRIAELETAIDRINDRITVFDERTHAASADPMPDRRECGEETFDALRIKGDGVLDDLAAIERHGRTRVEQVSAKLDEAVTEIEHQRDSARRNASMIETVQNDVDVLRRCMEKAHGEAMRSAEQLATRTRELNAETENGLSGMRGEFERLMREIRAAMTTQERLGTERARELEAMSARALAELRASVGQARAATEQDRCRIEESAGQAAQKIESSAREWMKGAAALRQEVDSLRREGAVIRGELAKSIETGRGDLSGISDQIAGQLAAARSEATQLATELSSVGGRWRSEVAEAARKLEENPPGRQVEKLWEDVAALVTWGRRATEECRQMTDGLVVRGREAGNQLEARLAKLKQGATEDHRMLTDGLAARSRTIGEEVEARLAALKQTAMDDAEAVGRGYSRILAEARTEAEKLRGQFDAIAGRVHDSLESMNLRSEMVRAETSDFATARDRAAELLRRTEETIKMLEGEVRELHQQLIAERTEDEKTRTAFARQDEEREERSRKLLDRAGEIEQKARELVTLPDQIRQQAATLISDLRRTVEATVDSLQTHFAAERTSFDAIRDGFMAQVQQRDEQSRQLLKRAGEIESRFQHLLQVPEQANREAEARRDELRNMTMAVTNILKRLIEADAVARQRIEEVRQSNGSADARLSQLRQQLANVGRLVDVIRRMQGSLETRIFQRGGTSQTANRPSPTPTPAPRIIYSRNAFAAAKTARLRGLAPATNR